MTETILKIYGMMCGMCENHVCDTIRVSPHFLFIHRQRFR